MANQKKSDALKILLRNPLNPDIDMYILVTVPHMFLILLIERICSNIMTFHLSFIVMIRTFDQAVILLREIR